MKTNALFTLLIAAIAASLWLPNLFTYGMFMDGVINASVAKLYAEGTGTFFNLQERYYANSTYIGHPPLAFVMQGTFFKFFGTAYYMDKLYSMLCAIMQLLLIVYTWRTIADKKLKAYAWLPCLLWLISPLISWGYSSNLLENSMSLFTTAALTAVLSYVRNSKQMTIMAVLTGILVSAGLLCKGPVALFVLAAPVLLVETKEGYSLKKAIVFSATIITVLALLSMAMLQIHDAQIFVNGYLHEQLAPSVSGKGTSLINRLQLISNLLKALLPLLIVATIILIGKRWLPYTDDKQEHTLGIRLLLLGLCGTLPIMLSNKQSSFYVIPAMPVFALAFALLVAVPVHMLCEKYMSLKVRSTINALSFISIVALCLLSIWNMGNVIRDVDMIRDLDRVGKIMDKEEILLDPQNEFAEEYHLKAYLSRLYGKTIDTKGTSSWVIIKKGSPALGLAESAYNGKTVHLLYRAKQFQNPGD